MQKFGWHKQMSPPLYLKLGLMKHSVKAMDRNGDYMTYIWGKFSAFLYKKLTLHASF